jgi:hypothetical protein
MGGRDSNSGLKADAPWLSPNHSLNCGDVILAAPSASYNSANFISGDWGKVSCPGGDNVAWLKCARFDACKITSDTGPAGILIDQSYWGVQGWEVKMTSGAVWGGCFIASPNRQRPVEIHHVIFANNVANGCQAHGLASFNRGGNASVDYLAIIGNVAYNAAQSNTECYSGISVNQPMRSDSLPGTHIYVAGNFSYGNFDPSPCAGMRPTDGEGIIFDTFDNRLGGSPSPYAAQAMVDNNMLIANGGRGMEVVDNNKATSATIYIRHNTIWGNDRDTHQNATECGELTIQNDSTTIVTENLIATSSATGCGANPISAISVISGDGTNRIDSNFAYAANGRDTGRWGNGTFFFGLANILGIDPLFQNPVTPGPPNCVGASSVPNCMTPMIANFTPTIALALSFGYRRPGTALAYDPLFPQWLCNVNLPPGLVTMGCPT